MESLEAGPTITLPPADTSSPSPSLTAAPDRVLAGTKLPAPAEILSPENAGRMAALAEWENGFSVESLAFAPDGKTIASAGDGLPLKIRRMEDGTVLREFVVSPENESWTRFVAFTPDGQTLVTGSDDNIVRLWRAEDGVLLRSLGRANGEERIISMDLSPDGTILAAGSSSGFLRIWRLRDVGLLKEIYLIEKPGEIEAYPAGLAFSPDGKILAVGTEHYGGPRILTRVTIYRRDDWKILGAWDGWETNENADIPSLAFSPDGGILIAGFNVMNSLTRGALVAWLVSVGTVLFSRTGRAVRRLAVAPDGRLLAAGLGDGDLQLWNAGDGTPLQTLRGHTDQVWSVVFSPDGRLLASGSYDGTVRIWAVR